LFADFPTLNYYFGVTELTGQPVESQVEYQYILCSANVFDSDFDKKPKPPYDDIATTAENLDRHFLPVFSSPLRFF
jgi:hypothetical protein